MMVPIIEYEIPNLNNGEKKCIIIFESCSCLFVFFVLLSFFHPPQKDPQAWFQVVDMDGDGDLNAREVFEVLKAQFPIDYNRLEQVY